jgi:hypothetical protein
VSGHATGPSVGDVTRLESMASPWSVEASPWAVLDTLDALERKYGANDHGKQCGHWHCIFPTSLPCALPSSPACQTLDRTPPSLVRQPSPLLADRKRREEVRRILLVDGKRRRILLAGCSAPHSWVCCSPLLL